jgi:hypothetical protein
VEYSRVKFPKQGQKCCDVEIRPSSKVGKQIRLWPWPPADVRD